MKFIYTLMTGIVFLSFATSNQVFASTCDNQSIPTGRIYADDGLSRLQVDGDGYTIFRYKLPGNGESDWFAFESSSTIGKQYLALMSAAVLTGAKFSFYVPQNKPCQGSSLIVDKIQIQRN